MNGHKLKIICNQRSDEVTYCFLEFPAAERIEFYLSCLLSSFLLIFLNSNLSTYMISTVNNKLYVLCLVSYMIETRPFLITCCTTLRIPGRIQGGNIAKKEDRIQGLEMSRIMGWPATVVQIPVFQLLN